MKRTGFRCGLAVFTIIGVSLSGGCASSEPRGDYERFQTLVRDRTGGAEPFNPQGEAAAEQQVERILTAGLTVDAAVQIALLNNPEFQSLVAEIGASRADVAQSQLFTNPTLSLGLQFPEGGGLSDLSVGFAAQIADLWQIPVRKKLAEAELERVIHSVGQRAVELAAETRLRCYRVLALEQALAIIQENQQLVQRAVALSETQFRAGEVSEFDVNLARSSSIDIQEELIATQGQLAQARVDLAQSLGLIAKAGELRLQDSLPTPNGALPATDAVLDRALDDRFDVRMAWFNVQRAEAALQLECRKFLPDVQLGFAFERGEQRTLPGRKLLADTARASIAAGQLTAPAIQSRGERNIEKSQIIDAKLGPTVALTLPIFDQNQAQVEKARIRVLQARKDYQARAEAAAAEVLHSVAALRSAAELLDFLRSQGLAQAQATVDGAERRYQAGEESLLSLIEAQDFLVKRRRSTVTALREYALALTELERAVGGHRSFSQATTTAPASQSTSGVSR